MGQSVDVAVIYLIRLLLWDPVRVFNGSLQVFRLPYQTTRSKVVGCSLRSTQTGKGPLNHLATLALLLKAIAACGSDRVLGQSDRATGYCDTEFPYPALHSEHKAIQRSIYPENGVLQRGGADADTLLHDVLRGSSPFSGATGQYGLVLLSYRRWPLLYQRFLHVKDQLSLAEA